ncbi:unnamed protein product, partial [Medioppia subpectinata]
MHNMAVTGVNVTYICLCIIISNIILVNCDTVSTTRTKQFKPNRHLGNLRQSPRSKINNTGNCGKEAYKDLDDLLAQVISNNERFPETIKELQFNCRNRSHVLPQIEDLKNRCMDGISKRVVAVVIYSAKRQRKVICRKKPNKRMLEVVGAGKCLNSFRPDALKCVEEAIDHACLLLNVKLTKECTEEHVSLGLRQSEQVTNGPMNMACGDYNEESDKCDKIDIPTRMSDQPRPKIRPTLVGFVSILGQTSDDDEDTPTPSKSILNSPCNKNTLKRVDEFLAKVTTYGNSGRKFPENTDQLPKYCNESKTLVENIESLNKRCIDGLAKRVLTVSIFTVKNVIKQLCRKNNKLLPEYFEAAKCINTVQGKVGKCFSKSIDHLLGMQFAIENKKIPMAYFTT